MFKPVTHRAIRRDGRKSPGVPGAAIAIFADRRVWRLYSPNVPVPAIFYAHRYESPVGSTNQVGRIYHVTFQNAPRWSLGTRLKCHIAGIGEKIRHVCPRQSVAKIACWRLNSPRSAYKIARCVAGFRGHTPIPQILPALFICQNWLVNRMYQKFYSRPRNFFSQFW